MAYEVKPAVEKTLTNLRETSEENVDEAISSFLHKFLINNEEGEISITSMYPKKDHERRKPANRELIEIELDDMKNANMDSIESALKLGSSFIDLLIPLIQNWFSSIR